MLKLFSPAEFKREAQAGRADGAGVLAPPVVLRGVDPARRIASFRFSDGRIDLQGDRIAASGWHLAQFAKNPVALYGHNSRELPVGKALNVRIDGDALRGDVQFPSRETYEFGNLVWRMVRDDFVRSVSVGFIPLEWDWAREPGRAGGIDFKKQILVEISICSIPANPGALLGAGLDDAERRAKAQRRRRQLDLLRLQHGP